jgi:hypothetical protein
VLLEGIALLSVIIETNITIMNENKQIEILPPLKIISSKLNEFIEILNNPKVNFI